MSNSANTQTVGSVSRVGKLKIPIVFLVLLLLAPAKTHSIDLGYGGKLGLANGWSEDFGFSLGGYLRLKFTKVLELDFELLYYQTPSPKSVFTTGGLSVSTITHAKYIEIPVLLHLNFRTGKVKPFMRLGPAFAMLLDADAHSTLTISGVLPLPVSAVIDADTIWGGTGNPNFNVALGFGAEWNVGNLKMHFEIRTRVYLTDPSPSFLSSLFGAPSSILPITPPAPIFSSSLVLGIGV